MKKETSKTTINLDKELLAEAKMYCVKNNITFTKYITNLLIKDLKKNNK